MSVEYRPSDTALGAAVLRALAAMDGRKERGGSDWLAEIFLSADQRLSLKDPAVRERLLRKRIAPGMYEFMRARTAFFDGIVVQALRDDIPQIVFMGAGYDSRSYRFREMIRNTRIFELDIEPTQRRKLDLLNREGVSVPEQVVFVPINFKTDPLGDRLDRAGFDRGRRTLFVWEGVTYYLSAPVVEGTLRAARTCSPAGSLIGFDYASRSPEGATDEAVRKIRKMMQTHYPGEPARFGIPLGAIDPFLSSMGYRVVDHLNAPEMERKYLDPQEGPGAGKVPAPFCLVLAAVAEGRR